MARAKGNKNRAAQSTPPRPAAPPPDDTASSEQGPDDDDPDSLDDAISTDNQSSDSFTTPTVSSEGDVVFNTDQMHVPLEGVDGIDERKPDEHRALGWKDDGSQSSEAEEAVSIAESSEDNAAPDDRNGYHAPEQVRTPPTPSTAIMGSPRTSLAVSPALPQPDPAASTESPDTGRTRQTDASSLSNLSTVKDDETDATLPVAQDKVGLNSPEKNDSASELPPSSPSPGPTSKRPFSLSSEPDTPTAARSTPPASPARPKSVRRQSSLLASPFGAAPTDPTNVGREGSASLTQAVWRQSLGLNSSPAARALVDVMLHDESEDDDDRDEEQGNVAARAGRTVHASPRMAKRTGSAQRGLAVDELGSYGRNGAESYDDTDAFISNRYSVNMTAANAATSTCKSAPTRDTAAGGTASHSATESAVEDDRQPETADTGTQRLQAEFLKVRERQEHGGDELMAIDWDFWGWVMNDYEGVAQNQPRELSRAIQQGIPPALRGMTWQLMAAAKDANLELVYSQLLKQSSPHEKSIARDLSRTFPKHAYFSDAEGVGQENLFNVVKAYSLYDDEVGYTQGLQFIVGPLLLNMPDEEAFSVLVRLMKAYDLRSHYTPNMPGLQLRLFQFDRLVEELVPSVFLHLLRQGVKSSMYASQWFLTLFGYRFPLELVSAVFDLVFAEGVEAVFRFAVSLLRQNEAHLLTLDFEDLIDFLKNGLFEIYAPDEEELQDNPDAQYRVHEFVRDALQVRITPMMLDQFGEEWASLCAAQTAHTAELEALRKANLQLSIQVRQLEASLAQINAEHCDLVKQVVSSRLDREELEDELVKYKLAYADLSHHAASERASTSSLQGRRQSEISTASSRSGGDDGPPSAGPSLSPPPSLPSRSGSISAGGMGATAAALTGIGRGWFGGSGGGGPLRRTSSSMSNGGGGNNSGS